MTSKLQVTIPKAIADRYGIAPGEEIDWLPAGEAIRVVPHAASPSRIDSRQRLALFDAATARQERRQRGKLAMQRKDRGWTREELYQRGVAD